MWLQWLFHLMGPFKDQKGEGLREVAQGSPEPHRSAAHLLNTGGDLRLGAWVQLNLCWALGTKSKEVATPQGRADGSPTGCWHTERMQQKRREWPPAAQKVWQTAGERGQFAGVSGPSQGSGGKVGLVRALQDRGLQCCASSEWLEQSGEEEMQARPRRDRASVYEVLGHWGCCSLRWRLGMLALRKVLAPLL